MAINLVMLDPRFPINCEQIWPDFEHPSLRLPSGPISQWYFFWVLWANHPELHVLSFSLGLEQGAKESPVVLNGILVLVFSQQPHPFPLTLVGLDELFLQVARFCQTTVVSLKPGVG